MRARLGRALRSDRLNQPQFIAEEDVSTEAGVALAAVGIEDPKAGSPAGWAGPIAGDDHLRSLADHVPAEPDPRLTGQLEADPGRLPDRGLETARSARRLEDHQADPGPTRERGQAPEAIREGATAAGSRRQVDDEEVDRSPGQQRAGDRQALLGVGRGQHDEPLEPDPAGDRLHRVQRGREVQPGHDRAGRLSLRGEPQRERGPATRRAPPQGEAHPARDAARPEDGVELREAGREDPIRVRSGDPARLCRIVIRSLERHRRERPDDVAPPRSEGRQGRRQVRNGSSHRRASIEQMFE